MSSFGFDDDDDDYSNAASNRLASIFKSDSTKSQSNDSNKVKQQQQQQQTINKPIKTNESNAQPTAGVVFFSNIQLFKYVNNNYENQGKAGLALLNNTLNNQLVGYRLLLYITKTSPIASIKLTHNFKLSIPANNYSSFFDENNQPWSVMFDNENSNIEFAIEISLAKLNLMQLSGSYDSSKLLIQDLKLTNETTSIESNDSVEILTLIRLWKDMKITEEIENTKSKPLKIRLGKGKLPDVIEESILNLKQGSRRLIVVPASKLQPFYSNVPLNAILFYDITIQRIKKHSQKEQNEELPNIPVLNDVDLNRSRSDSVKDKAKAINDQVDDTKSEKSKLISRMAKMGKPMLPLSGAVIANIESDDDSADQIQKFQLPSQQQQQQFQSIQQQQQQKVNIPVVNNPVIQQQQQQFQQTNQQIDFATNALYQQQLLLQQQLAQQQQQQQQQIMNTNQLALYKPIQQPQQIITTQSQLISQSQPEPVDDINQQRQKTILLKLDTLNEKLEQIKSIQQQSSNTSSLPNMETGILLSNLTRIIKENEQHKKDLYEKSTKIEELNSKITELLARNQNFIEKSHLLLEQKNSSYSESSEKNVLRILELEQDKMKLTQDLTNLTSKISDLNIQINKQNMTEFELKQRFNEISKSYDSEKNEIERLKIDNLEYKSKLDAIQDEFKKERQHKKQIELELNRANDEKYEFKEQINSYEKLLNEKRLKYESDKKQFEVDMDETKKQYLSEISELKERLNKYRTNTNEINREQVKQLEADLTNEWKIKHEKALKLQEQKYERTIAQLNEEKENLNKQLNLINEQFKVQREKLNQSEISNEELKERVDELNIIEEKFKRFQSQALMMKERYENRIKELMDAEPDSDVLNEYVKKCMNMIFQKLKSQISLKNNYSGEGVLTAMLKLIKFVTIKLMQSKNENEEEEEAAIDFFSEFIVDFDEKLNEQKDDFENKIEKIKQDFSTKQEIMILQYEAKLKAAQELAIENSRINLEVSKKEIAVVELNIPKVNEEVEKFEKEINDKLIENVVEERITEKEILNVVEQVDDQNDVVENEINEEIEQENQIEDENHSNEIDNEQVDEQNIDEIIEQQEQVEVKEEVDDKPLENENENIINEPIIISNPLENELIEEKSIYDEINNDEVNNKSIYDEDNNKSIYDENPIEEKKSNNILDDDDDDDDDDMFKIKPPSIDNDNEKKEIKKKSLFDDDNDDNDDLFLFSKSNNNEPKLTASTSNSNNNKDEIKSSTVQNSNSFEPPPLVDDNDAQDDDIDWFK